VTFQRFLQLCAGRTAQLLNLSALASDAGISQPTARNWLSVLETSFIVFRLPAYSGNLRKRLVKMPKLHFYDTGLVCWLLGIRAADQLRSHPLRGALFETWAVTEILKNRMNANRPGGLFFYRDQHGLEADLIVEQGVRRRIVEAKIGQTPSADMLDVAARVRSVLEKKGPSEILAIYGGQNRQTRKEGLLLPWNQIPEIEG